VCARHMHNGKPEDDEETGLSEFHTLFPSKTLFIPRFSLINIIYLIMLMCDAVFSNFGISTRQVTTMGISMKR